MEFQSNLDEVLKKIKISKKQSLQEVGTFLTAEAQLRATVKSGNMKRSTTYNVPNEDEVDIGVTMEAPYAKYVEKGSSKQKAQPFIEPAIMDNINKIKDIAGSSFHANMGGG